MNLDFEKEFSQAILEKGLDYYNKGCVKNLKVDGNWIEALVKGSHQYHVSIELKENKIVYSQCDCPYFWDHEECKHVVAVLYRLVKGKQENDLSSILDKINEKDLKSFLADLMADDDKLYDLFRRRFSQYFPKISAQAYAKKIEDVIKWAAGDDGFIDYREGEKYVQGMQEFIDEAFDFAIKSDYEMAFLIVKIILETLSDADMDGSNGELEIVANGCIDVILKILDEASKDDKTVRDIFECVITELKTQELANYGIEFGDLIENFIEKKLFLDECESTLKETLKQLENQNRSYTKERYLAYLTELYDVTNNKEKKINLLESNLEVLEVFKECVCSMMETNELKDVIEFLQKYQKIYPQHQKYITNKLLEIYETNNMLNEYKEELYNAFFEYDKFNFEKYLTIKKLFNENDWLKERENILDKIKKSTSNNQEILANIYIEEKMIDELFELVSSKGNFNSYEKYLLPKYRDELIMLNIKEVEKLLLFASNRSNYRAIARELKNIKRLDIDEKYINDFVAFIKKQYPKKKALLQEISYAMF